MTTMLEKLESHTSTCAKCRSLRWQLSNHSRDLSAVARRMAGGYRVPNGALDRARRDRDESRTAAESHLREAH